MNLNLTELSREELIKIIETLILEVNNLKEENKRLKTQLSLNSSNSSIPPSLDGFKKKQKITLSERNQAKNQAVNKIIKDTLWKKLTVLI
jgi:hypothetical protein